MKASTVGFKEPSQDLHRKSPRIFILSLIISCITTLSLLIVPLPEEETGKKTYEPPPVVIHLQNIPKTRHTTALPAPSRPFTISGKPVEVDDFLPDDVTIEDTVRDVETLPSSPAVDLMAVTGAADEENEIFEYYAVEEPPVRTNSIIPEYPPMAERSNIQDTVFLRVLVNTEGTVDSVFVERGLKVFHSSSVKAAKATKFKPAKQNDRPVACWVILPFRFIIEE